MMPRGTQPIDKLSIGLNLMPFGTYAIFSPLLPESEVFYRTPELWGRPQTTWAFVHTPPTQRPKPGQE